MNESHFRKYGKYYLAVISVFLMVAFAMPTINQGAREFTEHVGRLDGKKISMNDMRGVGRDMELLRRISVTDDPMLRFPFYWNFALSNTSGESGMPMNSPLRWQSVRTRLFILISMLNERDRALHYYLLLQEARKQGMYATPAEVEGFLFSAFPPASGMSMTEPNRVAIQKFMEDAQVTEDRIHQAIAQGLSVLKLIDLAGEAIQPSLPQIEHMAVESRSQVRVAYAVLDAADASHKMPHPTEEQMKAHFEKYKGVLSRDAKTNPPLIDGKKLPIGYKLPDRVKIEYLKFDLADIRSKLTPTPDDAVRALKFYNDNPDRFRTEPPTTQQNFGPAPRPRVKSFDEVKKQLIDDQLTARAEKLQADMIRRAQSLLSEPWRNQRMNEKGFRDPLPRERWVSYNDPNNGVAVQLQKLRDFPGYLPTYISPAGLLSVEELAALPNIGQAMYQTQAEQASFADLAVHVRELVEPKDLYARLFLQVGVDGPVLRDRQGNAYIYRVVEAEKTREPKSIEEVRDAVRVDLQKLAAYEQLKAAGEKLAAEAKAGDFNALARKLDVSVKESESFSRMQRNFLGASEPTRLPGLEKVPQFVPEAFKLADQAPSGTQPAKGPRPASSFASDPTLQVFVLKLIDYRPLPRDEFEQQRSSVVADATVAPRLRFIPQFMAIKQVAERLNFVPNTPFSDE